jgi:signal transduction histidine kinase
MHGVRPTADLALALEDHGVGFDGDAAMADGALGLVGMSERAQSVGSHLEIESSQGSGTTIIGEMPLDPTASGDPIA